MKKRSFQDVVTEELPLSIHEEDLAATAGAAHTEPFIPDLGMPGRGFATTDAVGEESSDAPSVTPSPSPREGFATTHALGEEGMD